ncbi:hypothetical protein QQS21_009645 [Conoideocrella luteorostrata]|uniref:Uncharacterized protein n=1 Tax=Conoideocrella luteorostrata TaxID=1105319 RepID=A0AAJ0FQ47_9HYPO|nr:hypothetical protein QQS21_009645 [Conoideocrella luteorostrata]
MAAVQDMMTATSTALAEFGVLPDDIHLFGDKVMIVELEMVAKVTLRESVATEVALREAA